MEAKFSFEMRNDLAACHALFRVIAPVIWPTKKNRRLYLVAGLLWCVLLALRGYLLTQSGGSVLGDVWQSVLLALAFFCFLSAGCLGNKDALKKKIGKAAQASSKEEMCYHAEFGEEEMHLSTPGMEQYMRYAALTRLALCEGHYLLFIAPAKAYVIAQDCLPSGELPDFERFLQQKTGLTLERFEP